MHYPKSLTNIRSLRYLFLLLTLGVVAVALAAADSPVPTQAALQPPRLQRTQLKPELPNYDIRLTGKTDFEDFDLTSKPGRVRARQNARAPARLTAVDHFLNARPDAAQDVRAMSNETPPPRHVISPHEHSYPEHA